MISYRREVILLCSNIDGLRKIGLLRQQPRASQIACPDARGYYLFTLGYQKLSIFVSTLSNLVARKVIRATKANKDLSTPDSLIFQRYASLLTMIYTQSDLTCSGLLINV